MLVIEMASGADTPVEVAMSMIPIQKMLMTMYGSNVFFVASVCVPFVCRPISAVGLNMS